MLSLARRLVLGLSQWIGLASAMLAVLGMDGGGEWSLPESEPSGSTRASAGR